MDANMNSAIEFLIYCYFGNTEDPVDAAIDRAYVDMAAHTLKGFENNKEGTNKKWNLRWKASGSIKSQIECLNDESNYDRWHDELCGTIIDLYREPSLTYGQAQKWVNMTIKYIYIFKLIFENIDCDNRAKKIPVFFQNEENVKKLHIPLDGYILKALGKNNIVWSKISDKDDYDSIRSDKDFFWELENWNSLAEKYRKDDPNSYARYKKENANGKTGD